MQNFHIHMQSSSREKISFMSFKSISNTMTRIVQSYGLCLYSSAEYSSIPLGEYVFGCNQSQSDTQEKEVVVIMILPHIQIYRYIQIPTTYHPSVFVLETLSFFLVKYSIPPINFFNHQSSQKISKPFSLKSSMPMSLSMSFLPSKRTEEEWRNLKQTQQWSRGRGEGARKGRVQESEVIGHVLQTPLFFPPLLQ